MRTLDHGGNELAIGAVLAPWEATTVQGGKVAIDASTGVRINGANVVKADIVTSNGIIHVIDTVLLPPE